MLFLPLVILFPVVSYHTPEIIKCRGTGFMPCSIRRALSSLVPASSDSSSLRAHISAIFRRVIPRAVSRKVACRRFQRFRVSALWKSHKPPIQFLQFIFCLPSFIQS